MTAAATLITLTAAAQIQTTTNGTLISYPTTTASSPSPAQTYSTVAMAGHFGAGVTFGEPIGGTIKYFFTDNVAADTAMGWSVEDKSDFYMQADVLWNKYDLLKVRSGAMPVYFGIGQFVRLRDDDVGNQAGIRFPVGLSYFFDKVPIEIFGEVAPALDVSPSVRGEVNGGIGIRYWF